MTITSGWHSCNKNRIITCWAIFILSCTHSLRRIDYWSHVAVCWIIFFTIFFLIKNPFIIRAVKAKSGGGSSFLFSCVTGNCYWYVSCITSQLSRDDGFLLYHDFTQAWNSARDSLTQFFLWRFLSLTIHETFTKKIYCARA